tara:strand:- start:248 stop:982 length:735 start_codon:yes stop_codon:yes gene_type:complete
MFDFINSILILIFLTTTIVWIGLLYFFNFIYNPFLEKLDQNNKILIISQLIPKAILWFKIGALLSYFSALLLIFINNKEQLNSNIYFAICLIILNVLIYNVFYKTKLGKKNNLSNSIAFISILILIYCLITYANYSHKDWNLYLSATLFTIAINNIWFKIYPAYTNIINTINEKESPTTDDFGTYKLYAKHNVYISLLLIWSIINSYFVSYDCIIFYTLMIAVCFLIIFFLFKYSTKVKGFEKR